MILQSQQKRKQTSLILTIDNQNHKGKQNLKQQNLK